MASEIQELKINDKDGIQTVSARELYKCLLPHSKNQYGGTKEIDDYAISLDMAKQICMLQRSDKVGQQLMLNIKGIEFFGNIFQEKSA